MLAQKHDWMRRFYLFKSISKSTRTAGREDLFSQRMNMVSVVLYTFRRVDSCRSIQLSLLKPVSQFVVACEILDVDIEAISFGQL